MPREPQKSRQLYAKTLDQKTSTVDHSSRRLSSVALEWSASKIRKFMSARPRAYFSRLFRDGGFRSGMEIGVAGALRALRINY